MITLAFAGFFRFNELSALRYTDITMSEDYFKVEIRKSKTDQYRSGKEVIIAKGFTSACPYNMLLKYMSAASLDTTTQAFLFRPAFRSSKGCKLISKDKQLNYTGARERIIKMLSSVANQRREGVLH